MSIFSVLGPPAPAASRAGGRDRFSGTSPTGERLFENRLTSKDEGNFVRRHYPGRIQQGPRLTLIFPSNDAGQTHIVGRQPLAARGVGAIQFMFQSLSTNACTCNRTAPEE